MHFLTWRFAPSQTLSLRSQALVNGYTNLTAYIQLGLCGFTDVEVLHYVYQPKPWHKTDFDIHTTHDFVYFIYREYLQKALQAYQLG